MNSGSFYSVGELAQKMEANGIAEALVYHSVASGHNVMDGNRLLADEIAPFPNLKPVWAIMPHHTGDFPPPDELRDLLKQNNVRTVILSPGRNASRFSLDELTCGKLFDMLSECKIPMLLDNQSVSWGGLYGISKNHPGLKIIITNVHYGASMQIYPVLEACKNLRIETIGFKTFGGIEEVCRKYGADRLIFGSSMPIFSNAGAAGMIRYARISDEQKQMIAAKNLQNLLEEVSF